MVCFRNASLVEKIIEESILLKTKVQKLNNRENIDLKMRKENEQRRK